MEIDALGGLPEAALSGDYEQLQNAAQEAATDLIEQSVRETFGIEVPQVPDETSTSGEGSVEQEADAVLPWIDRLLDELSPSQP